MVVGTGAVVAGAVAGTVAEVGAGVVGATVVESTGPDGFDEGCAVVPEVTGDEVRAVAAVVEGGAAPAAVALRRVVTVGAIRRCGANVSRVTSTSRTRDSRRRRSPARPPSFPRARTCPRPRARRRTGAYPAAAWLLLRRDRRAERGAPLSVVTAASVVVAPVVARLRRRCRRDRGRRRNGGGRRDGRRGRLGRSGRGGRVVGPLSRRGGDRRGCRRFGARGRGQVRGQHLVPRRPRARVGRHAGRAGPRTRGSSTTGRSQSAARGVRPWPGGPTAEPSACRTRRGRPRRRHWSRSAPPTRRRRSGASAPTARSCLEPPRNVSSTKSRRNRTGSDAKFRPRPKFPGRRAPSTALGTR